MYTANSIQVQEQPPPGIRSDFLVNSKLANLTDLDAWPSLTPSFHFFTKYLFLAPTNLAPPQWNIVVPTPTPIPAPVDVSIPKPLPLPQIPPNMKLRRPLRLLYQDALDEIQQVPSLLQIAAVNVAIFISSTQIK
jgi:hypothetical protein